MAKQLVKYKEYNKKKTPSFLIFKSSSSIFASLVSLESLFNCLLEMKKKSHICQKSTKVPFVVTCHILLYLSQAYPQNIICQNFAELVKNELQISIKVSDKNQNAYTKLMIEGTLYT